MQRYVPRLAILAVVAALSGCAGEGLDASTLTTGASPDKSAFNPFSDGTASTSGPREVMQSPSLAEILKPGELPEMSFGRADAPVTLVKYMSLTCPYCKRFQADAFPSLKREYIDTGKVRFILREFPIGKQSGTATVALRCAPADKYLALYTKFLEQQGGWVSQEVRNEPILKVAAQVGVSGEQFSACLNDKTLVSRLNAIKERGRSLGIIGTPNFFLNTKLIKSVVTWPDLKAQIEAQLSGAAGTSH